MSNPPRTLQCKCGSYRLKFVKRVGSTVKFKCAKCGRRKQRTPKK